jgi:hypothetical protein
VQIHLTKDEELSDRQLSRRQEFLRAVTFRKPYSVLESRALLEKSGLSQQKAKLVVEVTFFGSFALFLGFCFAFLRLFGPIRDTGLGFWIYLMLGLVFMYATHYYLAKFLVRYFKANQ